MENTQLKQDTNETFRSPQCPVANEVSIFHVSIDFDGHVTQYVYMLPRATFDTEIDVIEHVCRTYPSGYSEDSDRALTHGDVGRDLIDCLMGISDPPNTDEDRVDTWKAILDSTEYSLSNRGFRGRNPFLVDSIHCLFVRASGISPYRGHDASLR